MSENASATERSHLPERMTWDELAALPEDIARGIELHHNRVVFVRTGPPRHQRFYRRLANALEHSAATGSANHTGDCWQVDVETNVFFEGDKSDFRTPDFLVYRCQDSGETDIHAHDVVLAGEILSPANTYGAIQAKKAKYASARIPWYWEADHDGDAIGAIRAFALGHTTALPDGVVPLRPHNYILVNEWTPGSHPGIQITHPFPIDIAWDALQF